MAVVHTVREDVVRDTRSRALLPINIDKLQEHRRFRQATQRTKVQQSQVLSKLTELETKLNRFEATMSEMSQLIERLLSR